MRIQAMGAAISARLPRRRISRILSTVLAVTMLQFTGLATAPTSFALPGNAGPTTVSGTCSAAVGETTYINITLISDAFCLARVDTTTTWTVPVGVTAIDILIVGGGGGGGQDGGGGGGGGEVRVITGLSVTAGWQATATVGAGGRGGRWLTPGYGADAGSDSSFAINSTTYTSKGGAGAAGATGTDTPNYAGGGWTRAGGSGGTVLKKTVTPDDTSKGGRTAKQISGSTSVDATSVGYDGATTNFTGVSKTFGGGGGGGIWCNSVGTATFGGVLGGAGGGGTGAIHTIDLGSTAGFPGVDGLGGGGGGGSADNDGGSDDNNARTRGGKGGTGVVYIKYVPAIGITAQPQSQTGKINATTTFSATPFATLTGGVTRSKQWQLKVPSGVWANIAGENGDVYTTPTISRSMNGYQYRYVITDTYGTAVAKTESNAATLTVSAPAQGESDTALGPGSSTHNDASLNLNGTELIKPLSSDTYTSEAWVHPTNICTNADCTILGREENYVLTYNSGELRFVYFNSTAWGSWQSTGVNLPLNQWSHVALTKNSSTYVLYVNGAKVFSTTLTYVPKAESTYLFYVGNRNGGSYPFKGYIDEVKLWKTERSAASVAIDMHRTVVDDPGLIAYWNFNESSGTVAYNQVPGASGDTDLTLYANDLWNSSSISTRELNDAYTVQKFFRSYLTLNGGWKSPAGVSRVSTLLVAGGGGGGGGLNGAGGGAGGFIETSVNVTASTYYQVQVGTGGVGAVIGSLWATAPANGADSTAFSLTAFGGGKGGAEFNVPYAHYAASTGGSGGGGSWGNIPASRTGANGTSGQGNKGGNSSSISSVYAGAGGGGASTGSDGIGANVTSSGGGAGGAGRYSVITNSILAGGGGGSMRNGSNGAGAGGAGGTGGGGAGANSGAATPNTTNGPQSGLPNTGGGGGGGVYQGAATDGKGAQGGTGIVAVRWITAAKPIFTQPVIDTTTAGLTDTITVSANPISPLTRNYQWQSSNDTGTTWVNIPVGTGSGIASQTYTTPILETSTSGIRYQYRVVVTDSDTVGLSIVDTSTAVYIVINPRITITGTYTTLKYGVAHTDTFTVGASTGTGTKTITFANGNRTGISWNTSLANNAALTIASTLGPGTYYDTITATDTKGAATSLAVSIVVSKADTITVTALAVNDTYTGSILLFSESYTITGLVNTDTVTAISWSYSGTQNGLGSYGPIATKPVNAGAYTMTPVPTIRNSDSYTAVVINNAPLTINRATRTLSLTGAPATLKFGSQASLTATPSAGSGDGTISYSSLSSDTCTVSSNYVLALKSTGRCNVSSTISRGANYETSTSLGAGINLSKADTITVTVNAINPVTYTGNSAAVTPSVTVTGLVSGNTAAATPVTYNYLATAAAATCATGGTCVVGDTGPGGGKVFYVASSQQSWGRYLEAAPATWSGTTDNAVANIVKWCVATSSVDSTIFGNLPDGIGQGYANTYNASLNACTGGAIKLARNYRGAGLSDWYLPTGAELAVMATVSNRTLLGLVNDANLWGYWGSNETSDNTGNIGSLVTAGWAIGATIKGETAKNMTRPIRAFSPVDPTVTTYSNPPIDADTYTVQASALTLSFGSLSDYKGVSYVDGTLRINRAQQSPLVIAQYAAIFGTPYKIMVYSGSGTGAMTFSVTTGTAANCSLSGDTVTATTVGTCSITATKAQDKNYETATATAFIFFVNFQPSQPIPAAGSGSGMSLEGKTSLTIDLTTPPVITSLSTYSAARSTQIEINGTGFSAGSLVVKFWRNQLGGTPASMTDSKITIVIPSGATTGKVFVGTVNGETFSEQSLVITP